MSLLKLIRRTPVQKKNHLVPLVTPAQRVKIINLQSEIDHLIENSDAPISDKIHDGMYNVDLVVKGMYDVAGYKNELEEVLESRGLEKDERVDQLIYDSVKKELYVWDGSAIVERLESVKSHYIPSEKT